MKRQFDNAMHMANSPTCLQKTFASPMTARELGVANCQVALGDCASRCESRWRHWPNPERQAACMALCETQMETCVDAAKTMPPRMRHCPYNEVDDEQTRWRETATGTTGRPWQNVNGGLADYGIGSGMQHSVFGISGSAIMDLEKPSHNRELIVLLLVLAVLVVGSLVVLRER